MIAFMVGLVVIFVAIVLGIGCLFIVDTIGSETIIIIVVICILAYLLGNVILDTF